MDTQSLIRSVVIGGNFFFGVVLTIWMIALSTNKDRVGAQIFHTSISQQTHDPLLENTIRVMSNATETGVSDIPLIEVSRSNDGYLINRGCTPTVPILLELGHFELLCTDQLDVPIR